MNINLRKRTRLEDGSGSRRCLEIRWWPQLAVWGQARQEEWCGVWLSACSMRRCLTTMFVLCRHCRYNTQKLTELILQFYGIRADMKRECKHARMSMKVSLPVGELDGLVGEGSMSVKLHT